MISIPYIDKLGSGQVSRRAIMTAVLALTLAASASFGGWQLYRRLTTNTVVAYFSEATALYSGDQVQVMGAPVGAIDTIEPAGDKMKVTFHYASKYKVPANATAVVLNPTLVAARVIQLEPAYRGGPVLADHAVIPVERTQVPVEWDDLRNSISAIVSKMGPSSDQPKGPVGEVIESLADGLADKGKQINATLSSLSTSLGVLHEGRGDLFAVVRSLAMFVNALRGDDQQFAALNHNLAQFTDSLTSSDHALADVTQKADDLLATAGPFLSKNSEALVADINNVSEVTTAIVQPEPRDGLETALHVLPQLGANSLATYEPAHGGILGVPVIPNFANPMEFLCSTIQAGSRLGFQESAELCAQYLAPILDAIKFNYLPFGLNPFNLAATLPKHIAYSEPRLHPPPGFKDTTVPGIFSPDTPLSHRNRQPGWIAAPGMQGVTTQPATQRLLTADSLAELMGGPDVAPPPTMGTEPSAPDADVDGSSSTPAGPPLPSSQAPAVNGPRQ